MGQPTPEPPKNTGTPPLILRMPISSDERAKPQEKLTLKNVSAVVSVVSTKRHYYQYVWVALYNVYWF